MAPSDRRDERPNRRPPSRGSRPDNVTRRQGSADATRLPQQADTNELTVPPPPDAAATVFGDKLQAAERYVALLATEGIRRGLIGPREAPRLWDRHLLNCAAVLALVPEPVDVLDLGSGAGLPGIVLAIQRPTMRVTLLEPLLRRTVFLDMCVRDLGLDNVTVVRGRGETVAGQISADVVVARAVAPFERLARIALPLVRPGGQLIAMKGEGPERELEEARPTLRRLGIARAEATTVTLRHAAATAFVVVVRQAG